MRCSCVKAARLAFTQFITELRVETSDFPIQSPCVQGEHRAVCSSVPPLHPSLPALINAPLFCWAASSSLLSQFELYLQYLLTVLPLKSNTMGGPVAPRTADSLLSFEVFLPPLIKISSGFLRGARGRNKHCVSFRTEWLFEQGLYTRQKITEL